MLKKLVVLLMLAVCCYCEENSTSTILPMDTRAKKNKKSLRLLAMIALLVLSKVVIFKVASFFLFFTFFQKLFSVGGVLLTYFMKTQLGAPSPPPVPAPSVAPVAPPSTSYGSPTDYNTLGYSYGPPDHESAFQNDGPSFGDFGGPYNWIMGKA